MSKKIEKADLKEDLSGENKIDAVSASIFITNQVGARDIKELKEQRISRVLCLTEGEVLPEHQNLYKTNGISLTHIPLSTDEKNTDSAVFIKNKDRIYDFIQNTIKQKHRLLIYCQQGSNVSPAAVVYFTMRNIYNTGKVHEALYWGLVDALTAKRKCINIQSGLMHALQTLEIEMAQHYNLRVNFEAENKRRLGTLALKKMGEASVLIKQNGKSIVYTDQKQIAVIDGSLTLAGALQLVKQDAANKAPNTVSRQSQ